MTRCSVCGKRISLSTGKNIIHWIAMYIGRVAIERICCDKCFKEGK